METAQAPAGSIVVGVDGSSAADLALDWAVRQAVLEHRPLTVVHAAHLLGTNGLAWLDTTGIDDGRLLDNLRVGGHDVLSDATARAHSSEPELVVHEVLSASDPRTALLELAAEATAVIVGSRGRGPVSSLLLGSVSVAVSKNAWCPVVVVRPGDSDIPRQGILVGVDGTQHSRPAVEFAYQMAALRSLPLTVVHCFWDAAHLTSAERDVPDHEAGLEDLRRLLSDAVSETRKKFPDVQDHLQLMRGFSDQRLVQASQVMDLMVVGSHRSGSVEKFAFGSIASTVAEHARCSVAVVPSM